MFQAEGPPACGWKQPKGVWGPLTQALQGSEKGVRSSGGQVGMPVST